MHFRGRPRYENAGPTASTALMRNYHVRPQKYTALKRRENISDQTTIETQKVRKRFLPAWYLPNGTKNADENELEGASESCERWSIWCGTLVIVSIIAELILAVIQPPYESFLKLSVLSDAGVAIGIVGEVLFAMWNNRIQTELRVRSNTKLAGAIAHASDANERAASAELELTRLKAQLAWRTITTQQEMLLKHSLSELSGASVMIWHFIHDPESQNFSEDIAAIFRLSGWSTIVQPARFKGNFAFGIRIPNARGEDEKASNIIDKAFTNAGLDFLPLDIPSPEMLAGQHGASSLGHPHTNIYIGPRGKLDA
jgi:hypothetical protein